MAGAMLAQAQTPAKVDFAQDVQPLLRQNCVGCHGPLKQNGGLRLDRRSSAMKPISRRIVPGNSANSLLYHRVIGEFGAPMPPTGDLKPEQVATLKNWIDQGAEWPDALANEAELPPLDPAAIAAVEMLHEGDLAGFMRRMEAKPALLNARGPEGSTPFMYAALYADAAAIARLVKLGAEVNAHNDANATALMWVAHDLAKTTVLVSHGANVNAKSDDFRTPLMIAARKPGGAAIVRLLLAHGAEANPNARPDTQSSPLLEAATAGDAASFVLLLDHGAKIQDDAEPLLVMAVTLKCARCVELAVPKITDKHVYTSALLDTAYLGDTAAVKMMLAHGADVKAFDPLGHTALMYAVASDVLPMEAVKLLVAQGADVNAKSKRTKSGDEGLTVLDMARRHGHTAILDYLVASGAKEVAPPPLTLHWRVDADMRGSIQDSIPLLQRADATFAKNSGCVSCHNNSLTAMTVGMARSKGFEIDEKTAAAQVQVNVDSLAKARDQMNEGFIFPTEDNFSDNVVGYTLLGLGAQGYKADLNTDLAAMYILWRQNANGEWPYPHADTRQPLCLDYVGQTALAMRSLQLYAPKLNAAAYRQAVAAGGFVAGDGEVREQR